MKMNKQGNAFSLSISQPDLKRRIDFLLGRRSKNVKTVASKVREHPKFLPITHYHSPSPTQHEIQ